MPDMLALFSNPGYNISYHLLIPVFIQAMAAGTRGSTRRLGYFDNVCPREVIDRIAAEGKVKPATVDKLRRRAAAHANCIDGLPTIIGAVIAGNVAGLGAKYMNTMVLTYLALRTAYIYLYITVTDQKRSFIRSLVWWACNFCFMVTFWKAGNRLNLGPSSRIGLPHNPRL